MEQKGPTGRLGRNAASRTGFDGVVDYYQNEDTKKAPNLSARGGKLDKKYCQCEQCYRGGRRNVKPDCICETPCFNLFSYDAFNSSNVIHVSIP